MQTYSNLGPPEPEILDPEPDREEEVFRFSEEEVADGLDGARFSYLFNFFGMPFCLIPLLKRENAFSLFHAKQAFLLWILFFSCLVIGWSLCWISLKALWIFVLGGGGSLALNVLGYQRVLEEKEAPLPGVGPLAENWFKGIQVEDEEEKEL